MNFQMDFRNSTPLARGKQMGPLPFVVPLFLEYTIYIAYMDYRFPFAECRMRGEEKTSVQNP